MAEHKHPGGRPNKFQDIDAFTEEIERYFKKCDQEERPYTVTGLAAALDTDRSVIIDVENGKNGYNQQFSHAIKSAKRKILSQQEERLVSGKCNPAGLIFSMKNNYGWRDKVDLDVDQRNSGTIEIVFSNPRQENNGK